MHERMLWLGALLVAFPLLATPLLTSRAAAQEAHGSHGAQPDATPPDLTVAQRAALRFPQPVRVGDLPNRDVLDMSNHLTVIAHVDDVVRTADGALELVVHYGGFLGFDTRLIAVPIGATSLVGPYMRINDLSPAQLEALPTFSGAGTTKVPPDEIIRVGVDRK